MLTEQRLSADGNVRTFNKVDAAVQRIREACSAYGGQPAWVAFSGGKDSTVLLDLVRRSGVPFEAHYSVTSVDPPELVALIKRTPGVIMDIPRYNDGSPITMWNLIPRQLMPPTRIVRYCCAALKESAGMGRLTITGVRWAESLRRKNSWGALNVTGKRKLRKAEELGIELKATGRDRGALDPLDYTDADLDGEIEDYIQPNEKTVMLNNDNGRFRRFMEFCTGRGKTTLNPIVDWSDEDVWEYIENEKLPYCSLYTQAGGAYTRLGCIGCPMSTRSENELDAYPKYKNAYLRAFERMLRERKRRGLDTTWKTPDEVMDWWLHSEKRKGAAKSHSNTYAGNG